MSEHQLEPEPKPEVVPIPVQVMPTFDPPGHAVGTVEVKISVELPTDIPLVPIQSINIWLKGADTTAYLVSWHTSVNGTQPLKTLNKVKAEQTVYVDYDQNKKYCGIVAEVTFGQYEGSNPDYIFTTPVTQ